MFGDAWKEGVYINNPHILTRFSLPPGDHLFTLVVSQVSPCTVAGHGTAPVLHNGFVEPVCTGFSLGLGAPAWLCIGCAIGCSLTGVHDWSA